MKSPERKIAEAIAESNGLTITKLGLRFDRVVLGFLDDLRTFANRSLPKEVTLIFTITAPIRLAAKTELIVEKRITGLLSSDLTSVDKKLLINRNQIRIKVIASSKRSPKFIGFVHNPSTKAQLLVGMASEWLKPVPSRHLPADRSR